MNKYVELKERHQEEVDSFPMVFAFNEKQFEEGMEELGLKPTDTDKVFSLGSTGGIYRRSDAEKLLAMFDRHKTEMDEAIQQDLTGDGFIFDMFNYELGNHEYTYTGEIEQTIDALGLTIEEINANKQLKYGLEKACKAQWDWLKNNG